MATTSVKCHKAKILSDMYNNETIHLYLIFLKPILHEVQTVNKVFQSNENDPTRLLKEITLLINFLKKKVLDDANIDVFSEDFETYISFKCYLGFEFETYANKLKEAGKLSASNEQEIRNKCADFIVGLMNQLKQRYEFDFI